MQERYRLRARGFSRSTDNMSFGDNLLYGESRAGIQREQNVQVVCELLVVCLKQVSRRLIQEE